MSYLSFLVCVVVTGLVSWILLLLLATLLRFIQLMFARNPSDVMKDEAGHDRKN